MKLHARNGGNNDMGRRVFISSPIPLPRFSHASKSRTSPSLITHRRGMRSTLPSLSSGHARRPVPHVHAEPPSRADPSKPIDPKELAEYGIEIALAEGAVHGPLYYTTVGLSSYHNATYMKQRTEKVHQHFPGALGIDDFMHRAETALYSFGFSAENSIAMTNLCRDEVCIALKDKIDGVFGWSFSTVGVGGVLTCGITGMRAGLSHSPVEGAKERYVFFSMPHIAIDSKGHVGAISRPGRPDDEGACACGALHNLTRHFNMHGIESALSPKTSLDWKDIELSVLRIRLAQRIDIRGKDPSKLSVVDVTKLTERVLYEDLEDLISAAVDTKKADYAVITGVQIHNWTTVEDGAGAPNLEFVQPVSVYVVVDGKRRDLSLASFPPLTPRQVRILALHDRLPIRRGWESL